MFVFRCLVITPEKTLRDTEAEFVALPLVDGEIGIGPGRRAMIGRLGAGEMRITTDTRVSRYYVEGGFVEVVGDTVSVLATQAVPVEELDEMAALDQLDKSGKLPSGTPELWAIRQREADRARAQCRVIRRARQAKE